MASPDQSLDPPNLSTEDVRAFLDAQLMMDVHFANEIMSDLASEVRSVIEDAVTTTERLRWTKEEQTAAYGTIAAPESIHQNAVRNALVTTAALIAHGATGTTGVTMNEIGRAMDRLFAFTKANGMAPLVRIYGTLVALENHVAVAYYAPMPVEDFVSGHLHRPYAGRELLREELMTSVRIGSFAIEKVHGVQCVTQTDRGRQRYERYRAELGGSGFTASRKSALIAVEMSRRDIERFIRELGSDVTPLRHKLVRWAGIHPGMAVLECGAAAGANVFEGGLVEVVGETGRIVATDPAVAMIDRLQRRTRKAGRTNVEAVVAKAEDLPFADGTFDVVMGSGFLAFTELDRAIAEMLRVLRPGGTLAVFGPVQTRFFDVPWFRDWFAPALSVAERFDVPVSQKLPDKGVVPQALDRAGAEAVETQDDVITVRAISPEGLVYWALTTDLLGSVTERLPCGAREDFWAELIQRGRVVCAEVPVEQRIVRWPVEFVRAKRTG